MGIKRHDSFKVVEPSLLCTLNMISIRDPTLGSVKKIAHSEYVH